VDSVTVNVIPNPMNPNLFAVDSLFHCGDSLVLDAATGYSRYEWRPNLKVFNLEPFYFGR
ncbi:MAG: hypothetical protein ACKOHH_11300, partial [Bacteroidota bacterium]